MKEVLKISSRQPRRAPVRSAESSSPCHRHGRAVEHEVAPADAHRVEQEAVPGEPRVQPSAALRESREMRTAGGESDAGAHRRDVVEMAPDPLQLEQDRARACHSCARDKAERRLARLRIRDAVGDRAGGTGTLGVGDPVAELGSLGGPLEPAVLVEQPSVEVQDAIAHEVEAEVPGLDHAGMDGADRNLVRIVTADRHGPARNVRLVVDEWPERLWPSKSDAVEVVRLTLVPLCGRREIDDRGRDRVLHVRRLDAELPSGARNRARTSVPPPDACNPANVQPSASKGETPARYECPFS